MPGQQNSFWTVSNCTGRGILFLQPPPTPIAAFGRAALHLSNQRPRGFLAGSSLRLAEGEKERQRGREKKRGSCCNFVSLTFAFGACSIDIGNCGRRHAAGNEIILLLEYSSRYTRRIFYPFYR